MSIQLQCKGCGKTYQIKEELRGKRVTCRCGQSMIVPTRTAELQPSPTPPQNELSDLSSDDPFSSAVDEELRLAGGDQPAPGLAAAADYAALGIKNPVAAVPAAEKKTKKDDDDRKLSRGAIVLIASGVGGLVLILIIVVAVFVLASMQSGFASPEEAFAAYQEAVSKKDWKAQFHTMTPPTQEKLMAAIGWMALSRHKNRDEIRAVFDKHGLSSFTKPNPQLDFKEPTAEEIQQTQSDLLAAIEDQPDFYEDLAAALLDAEEQRVGNPLLKVQHRKAREAVLRAVASAELKNLAVQGETAEAEMSLTIADITMDLPISFKRVEGGWLLDLPNPESTYGSPTLDTSSMADFF